MGFGDISWGVVGWNVNSNIVSVKTAGTNLKVYLANSNPLRLPEELVCIKSGKLFNLIKKHKSQYFEINKPGKTSKSFSLQWYI